MSDRTKINPVPAESIDNDNAESTIDFVELAYRIIANWKLIVALVLIAALAAGVYTTCFVAPKYQATAVIYVVSSGDSVVNLSDLQLGSALTSDYIKVFSMWEVHEQVISNLNLPYTYSQMKRMLSVTNTSGTRMIDISVKNTSPDMAAIIANEYAEVGSNYIAETMSTTRPNLMSKALTPTEKVSPNRTRSVTLAAVLGGLVGLAYVFFQTILDDKYKTANDIKKYTGLVTIALVPMEGDTSPRSPKSRKDKKWKK